MGVVGLWPMLNDACYSYTVDAISKIPPTSSNEFDDEARVRAAVVECIANSSPRLQSVNSFLVVVDGNIFLHHHSQEMLLHDILANMDPSLSIGGEPTAKRPRASSSRVRCTNSEGARCATYDPFFNAVFSDIFAKIAKITGQPYFNVSHAKIVDLVIVFDGVPPILKWETQLNRRRVDDLDDKTDQMKDVSSMTAFSDVMLHIQDFVDNVLFNRNSNINNFAGRFIDQITIIPPAYAGEGEIKMIDTLITAKCKGDYGKWDVAIAVTDDSDCLLHLAPKLDKVPAKEVYVYSSKQEQRMCHSTDVFEAKYGVEGTLQVSPVSIERACRYNGFFHIKDDFFTRFVGNDYTSPIGYLIPILMYGALDIVPTMLTPKAQFSHLVTPGIKNSSNFLYILYTVCENAAQSQSRTTNMRTNKRVGWTQREVTDVSKTYIRLLHWASKYVLGADDVKWYVNPSDLGHPRMAGGHYTCKITVADLMKVITESSRNIKSLEFVERRVAAVNAETGEEVSVLESRPLPMPHCPDSIADCIKILTGMYIMNAFDHDSTYHDLFSATDFANIRQRYEEYFESCVCKNKKSIYDPRDVLTISQTCNKSLLDAGTFLKNMFDLTVSRYYCLFTQYE